MESCSVILGISSAFKEVLCWIYLILSHLWIDKLKSFESKLGLYKLYCCVLKKKKETRNLILFHPMRLESSFFGNISKRSTSEFSSWKEWLLSSAGVSWKARLLEIYFAQNTKALQCWVMSEPSTGDIWGSLLKS